ncbi:PLP-dependent aminotransferase family protein [Actinocorallia longicatena]|uniref:PLP-dependent aminotransferase family protein n=1 Tax=Actinocorallia longicatena TaxID=111803 RepID=A0ABP6Q1D2_9ACTN
MSDLHLTVDRSRGRLGAQVAAELRRAVRDGRLTGGTRLPSSRALAHDLGVARGVIVSAYEQLVAEGFLLSRTGDGTRVAGSCAPADVAEPQERAGAECRAAETAGPYDLRPGVPDLSAFPRAAWLSALRHALAAMPHSEFAYPDPAGVAELREELAGYLGRVRAAVAAPGQIVITGGVAHGLSTVVRLLGGPLALEDPTSERQIPLLRATGVPLLPIPVDAEGMDVAALARSGARTALLTPAHQFPTGVVLSPARRAALLAWARETGGHVLEDDYDAEFRYDREPVGCLQGVAPDRVVLLGSVSKALAPALRLGWLVAPPALAAAAARHRVDTDLGSPAVDQHALAHLLASGRYDRHLRHMRRLYRSRRDALVEALAAHLPQARVEGVSAGLHLYVHLEGAEEGFFERASALGVTLQPTTPGALLLGYASQPPHRLAEAVRLLARAL